MGYNEDIKSQREKEFNRLSRELDQLRKKYRQLGYYKLEKPVRHGWYTYLTLRDDIARRKDAKVYAEIIEKCTVIAWGHDKIQAEKSWNRENSRNYRIQFPGFRTPGHKKWRKMSDKAKRHFRKVPYTGIYDKRYFCTVPEWYFVRTYERAYITHRKNIDPGLERKMDELHARLNQTEFYAMQDWAYYKADKWWRQWNHQSNRSKTKQILKQITKDDELESDYIYNPNENKWGW